VDERSLQRVSCAAQDALTSRLRASESARLALILSTMGPMPMSGLLAALAAAQRQGKICLNPASIRMIRGKVPGTFAPILLVNLCSAPSKAC
jgi:hypothetical protein